MIRRVTALTGGATGRSARMALGNRVYAGFPDGMAVPA